jgi:hypothetical protein
MNFYAGVNSTTVVVGDFNGDGVPDLAVANIGDCFESCEGISSVSVLLGNGDGTFRAAVDFHVGGGPVSMATADFNGDGLPDLAVGHVNFVGLSVLINNTPRQ